MKKYKVQVMSFSGGLFTYSIESDSFLIDKIGEMVIYRFTSKDGKMFIFPAKYTIISTEDE